MGFSLSNKYINKFSRGYFWTIKIWLQISFKYVSNYKLLDVIYNIKYSYEQCNSIKEVKVKFLIINGKGGETLTIQRGFGIYQLIFDRNCFFLFHLNFYFIFIYSLAELGILVSIFQTLINPVKLNPMKPSLPSTECDLAKIRQWLLNGQIGLDTFQC